MNSKKIQSLLAVNNLDGLLVTDKVNRRYLSGFTGSNGLLLITEKESHLFVDGRYTEQAQQQTKDTKICEIPVGSSLEELLAKKFKQQTFGFEAQTINYQTFKLFQTIAEKNIGKLVPTNFLIEKLRMIKTDEEISKIKKAAQLADETLAEIIPFIQAGMTEIELANEIDYRSKKKGSDGPAFETIVASGQRTALPHAHASHKKISVNELIMIDFGTINQGYYSDITRTFAFGQVSAEIETIYQKVLAVQKTAIKEVVTGKAFGELDQEARNGFAEDRIADFFSHNLGHGLGLSCHEYPSLAPHETTKIEKNMTFTIEPGIYLPQQFGIRIEDDILVNKEGTAEILTKFPKEWMMIDETC
ncbi:MULTISPECIES: M24 family metallopeptidase [Enterococcus]|uniref:Xaa-Pro peptidase family protein n=1 Tax=Enterococcus alishanensis TaxID=1303817 RepID=A0ABS6T9B9_9ENTE|nr:Xaa-Pro peptidase family protein [Enterococcus alishanensis]MBV7389492.1 Xaa-Pro peptidase family protein [Enterococcus alishanensis]